MSGRCYTLAIGVPLPSEEAECLLSGRCHTTVHQVTADECASPAFASIAVHTDNIIWISLQELVHGVTNIEEHVHRWILVVLPIVVGHSPIEKSLIVNSSRYVEDPEFALMLLLKEFAHVWHLISIQLLNKVLSRNAHSVGAWRDGCQVKVEAIFFISVSLAGHDLTKLVHICFI